jgi:hypothetical protein
MGLWEEWAAVVQRSADRGSKRGTAGTNGQLMVNVYSGLQLDLNKLKGTTIKQIGLYTSLPYPHHRSHTLMRSFNAEHAMEPNINNTNICHAILPSIHARPAPTLDTLRACPELTTVSRSLVTNYYPHLEPSTAGSAAGQELQLTLEWSAREMLAKYLRKFRTRRQFVEEQMGGMYTDEIVNCVRPFSSPVSFNAHRKLSPTFRRLIPSP